MNPVDMYVYHIIIMVLILYKETDGWEMERLIDKELFISELTI